MTEAQIKHACQMLVTLTVCTFVVGLVVWAVSLALGYNAPPLAVFGLSGVAVWVVDGMLYRWRRS